MLKCNACNKESTFGDDAKYCYHCGEKFKGNNTICEKCDKPSIGRPNFCYCCGEHFEENNNTNKWECIWFFSVVILPILVGVLLFSKFSFIDSWLYKIKLLSWHKLFGVWLIGIGVANCIISLILRGIDSLFDLQADRSKVPEKIYDFAPTFLGICEAILYPISFIIKKPEFIGVWIALKVASQWSGWQEGKYKGRHRFVKFMIGNALSIIFSFLIYAVFKGFVFN